MRRLWYIQVEKLDKNPLTKFDPFGIRFHGRGGQGVVTAAELLSVAAFLDGLHAQAFPSFGSERMGAPVVAFCRISEKNIRTREPISSPDALIIQDVTLIHQLDIFNGVNPDGFVLVNTSRTFDELGLEEFIRRFDRTRALTVPATEIALEHLGKPVANSALLAGFAAMSNEISLSSVKEAISRRFSGMIAEKNAEIAQSAFDYVAHELESTQASTSLSTSNAKGDLDA